MKTKHTLFAATVIAGLGAGAAHAQEQNFRSLDTNGDGVLTLTELLAVFGDEAANLVLQR